MGLPRADAGGVFQALQLLILLPRAFLITIKPDKRGDLSGTVHAFRSNVRFR